MLACGFAPRRVIPSFITKCEQSILHVAVSQVTVQCQRRAFPTPYAVPQPSEWCRIRGRSTGLEGILHIDDIPTTGKTMSPNAIRIIRAYNWRYLRCELSIRSTTSSTQPYRRRKASESRQSVELLQHYHGATPMNARRERRRSLSSLPTARVGRMFASRLYLTSVTDIQTSVVIRVS